MDVDLYSPSLPPHLGGKQSIEDSDLRHHLRDNQSMHESDPRHVSDDHSGHSEEPSWVVSARPKKHADKRKHKVRSKYPSSEEDQSSLYTNMGLPSPLGLLLIKTNLNVTQILSSIGT